MSVYRERNSLYMKLKKTNMNTKNVKKELFIGASILVSVGLCILVGYRKKGMKKEKKVAVQESIPEPEKPKIIETPEELLENILKSEIENGEWKNERNFLDRVTQKFIVGAKEMDWINILPISQEELQEKLEELGLTEEYEKKLEEKYKK